MAIRASSQTRRKLCVDLEGAFSERIPFLMAVAIRRGLDLLDVAPSCEIEHGLPATGAGVELYDLGNIRKNVNGLVGGAESLFLAVGSGQSGGGVRSLLEAGRICPGARICDGEQGVSRLVFIFHLAGRCEIKLDHSGQRELSRPTFAMCYRAKGAALNQGMQIWGEAESVVLLDFRTKRLSRSLCEALQHLPNCPDGQTEVAWAEWSLNSRMEQAAYQVLNPVVHERWRREFLKLKAAELFYLGLDAMLPNGERPESMEEPLPAKILRARSMLDNALQSPPSQSDLAQLVGLPVTAFSVAFRDVIGMAIPQYLSRRRIHRARMLIESTTMPLKQIAHEAGYSHTSNLCLALKRHFGKTAREMRMRRSSVRLLEA